MRQSVLEHVHTIAALAGFRLCRATWISEYCATRIDVSLSDAGAGVWEEHLVVSDEWLQKITEPRVEQELHQYLLVLKKRCEAHVPGVFYCVSGRALEVKAGWPPDSILLAGGHLYVSLRLDQISDQIRLGPCVARSGARYPCADGRVPEGARE